MDISAVDLSKIILSSVNNDLNKLGKLSRHQLTNFKGIGEAKAIKIVAAMEFGRRQRSSEFNNRSTIESSQSVFNLMRPILSPLSHEEFWILYLNNSKKQLAKYQLSKGGITTTTVDVRLVLKQALEQGAVSLILVHNHPSGAHKPSLSDINLTSKLQKAALTLEITVLDHIILTEKTYFSFADENML